MCMDIDRLCVLGSTIRNITVDMKRMKAEIHSSDDSITVEEFKERSERYATKLRDAVKEIEEQLDGVRGWDLDAITHSYLELLKGAGV